MYFSSLIAMFDLVLAAQAAVTVKQTQVTDFKVLGKTVTFTCLVRGVEDYTKVAIHWYQQKPGEPLKHILSAQTKGHEIQIDDNFRQESFGAIPLTTGADESSLIINNLKGVFVNALNTVGAMQIFGSGTQLFIGGKYSRSIPPKLTSYTPSLPNNGKIPLLCVATNMVPDVVKFKWQVNDSKGDRKDVLNGDGEVLDQKGNGMVASMLLIDKEKIRWNTYVCSVAHDTTKANLATTVTTPEGAIASQKNNRRSCALNNGIPQTPEISEDYFELTRTLYLAMLSYTIMIMKSIVYFSAVAVLMCQRSRAAVNESATPG